MHKSMQELSEMATPIDEESGSQDISLQAVDRRIERSVALFLLTVRERYQITQSAVDYAVGQLHQMVTYTAEDIQRSVETRLQSLHEATGVDMPDISDCFKVPDPFGHLQTE